MAETARTVLAGLRTGNRHGEPREPAGVGRWATRKGRMADERTPGGAILMDGKRLRDEITEQLAGELAALGNPPVCLGTVLVGDDRPSQIYVRSKHQQAEKAGMRSRHVGLPPTASQIEVEDEVAKLADDPDVHGILVQLPLPDGLDPEPVLDLVPPEKDIDGLTERSMGRLVRGRPGHVPCTPKGVLRLLERYGVEISGRARWWSVARRSSASRWCSCSPARGSTPR